MLKSLKRIEQDFLKNTIKEKKRKYLLIRSKDKTLYKNVNALCNKVFLFFKF